MFERFTDRARRVVVLAQEEARMLNHNYIGTEHVLLGLIHEGEGVAAMALVSMGIELDAVRQQVEDIIGLGQMAPSGHIPFTPRAKKVLELSLREALQLGHNYIGTEHILLGLIREGEGVAAQVLVKMGADLNRVRMLVIELVHAPKENKPAHPVTTPPGVTVSKAASLLDGFSKFTDPARHALTLAEEECRLFKHNSIGSEHILLGLIRVGDGAAAQALDSLGIGLDAAREQVRELVGEGKQAPPDIPFSPRSFRVLELSLREAQEHDHEFAGPGHILLGLTREAGGVAVQVLAKLGSDPSRVRQQVMRMLPGAVGSGPASQTAAGQRLVAVSLDAAGRNSWIRQLPVLARAGRDLTQAAVDGELDAVLGREAEIRRIVQVLTLRVRNSPLLVAEHGVGATAVVHGLAQAVARAEMQHKFGGTRICALDLGRLFGMLDDQRSVENYFAELFTEVRGRNDLILFVGNALTAIHTAGGTVLPVTLLRPILIDSAARVIATATPAEHHRYMQADRTLSSIFYPIPVNELPPGLSVEILKATRDRYEAHHGVSITYAALDAAVALSARHIKDRPLPGKAMDLLDEAAAQVALRGLGEQSAQLLSYDEEIARIRQEKEAALDAQDFEKAASLRDDEKKLLAKKDAEEKAAGNIVNVVDEKDVAEALTAVTMTAPAGVVGTKTDAPGAPAFPPSAMTGDDLEIWAMA